jgi:hypothetical protein
LSRDHENDEWNLHMRKTTYRTLLPSSAIAAVTTLTESAFAQSAGRRPNARGSQSSSSSSSAAPQENPMRLTAVDWADVYCDNTIANQCAARQVLPAGAGAPPIATIS